MCTYKSQLTLPVLRYNKNVTITQRVQKEKSGGVKVGMGGGIRLRMQAAISVCTKGAELTAAFHYEGDVVICQTSWPARPRCFDLFLVSLVLFLHIF